MACSFLLEFLLLMLLTSMIFQVNVSSQELQLDSSPELETISGFAFCDTCHDNQLSESSIVFEGVQVLVNCSSKGTNFSGVAVTSKTGQYSIKLPSNVAAPNCSVQLLTPPSPSSCNLTSDQLQVTTRTTTNYDIVYKPYKAFSFCARRQALTLGPPDPPKPSSPPTRLSSRTSSSFRSVKSYHLGPPDPPRPVSRSKRLGSGHG